MLGSPGGSELEGMKTGGSADVFKLVILLQTVESDAHQRKMWWKPHIKQGNTEVQNRKWKTQLQGLTVSYVKWFAQAVPLAWNVLLQIFIHPANSGQDLAPWHLLRGPGPPHLIQPQPNWMPSSPFYSVCHLALSKLSRLFIICCRFRLVLDHTCLVHCVSVEGHLAHHSPSNN